MRTKKNVADNWLQSEDVRYLRPLLSPVHTCHKMAPLNGTIKLPVWHRKMAPFITGAILLLDIEHISEQ